MAEVPAPVKGIVLVQTADARGLRLRDALTLRPEVEVLAEVATTLEAVASAGRLHPSVLVLDVGLTDLAGHGVLRSVRAVSPGTRVILHARAVPAENVPGTQRWISRLVEVIVDPVRSAALEARLVMSEDLRSVPMARGFVTDLLEEWNLADLVPTSALVATELVANAVRHVTGPCALELTHSEGVTRLAVADLGHGMPDLHVLDPTSENGRGLYIVSAFSTAWGVDHLDDGAKLVWAELAPQRTGTR